MAVLYAEHFVQFLDDDGNPLSGGKLYTYEAGTTTPKVTYTSQAADTQNANPVILDSAGRATVFIDGSYRFDLYDSSDNLIVSTDNVTSFDATGVTGSITNFSTITSATPEAADLFIFSDNSDSGTSKTVSLANLGGALGILTDNDIINSRFELWQEGTTRSSIADGDYFADIWEYGKSGAVVHDVTRSTDVPSGESGYSAKFDVTTADSSLAAGDYCYARIALRGADIAKYSFGQSGGKEIVIKFSVKSPKTGTHCVTVMNYAGTRAYIAEYTVSAANTWEAKTITLTADTSGTWVDEGVPGALYLYFALSAGATYQATAGSWQTVSSGEFASSNQVNTTDNASNDFYIFKPRMGIGNSGSVFRQRTYAEEYYACRKGFRRMGGDGIALAAGYCSSTTNAELASFTGEDMYAAPSISTANANQFRINPSAGTLTGISASLIGKNSHLLSVSVASGLTGGQGCVVYSGSGLNGYIDLDARV